MVKEHIISFLRTGQLENFPFGTYLETVLVTLGDNKEFAVAISKKDKRCALVKYDCIEFYFTTEEKQRLYGVQATYSLPAEPKGLLVDYAALLNPLNINQTKQFLNQHNISFFSAVHGSAEYDGQLSTTEGVTFYFDDNGQLEKFGRFIKKGELPKN